MKKDTYLLQAKRRINDPQVGKLLERIYELEQIITTNSGQFRIFYNKYMGVDLPDTVTLEEINTIKLYLLKNMLRSLSDCIENGVYYDERYEK